ncbi:unnamed protein product [Musa hybrid cultivar]
MSIQTAFPRVVFPSVTPATSSRRRPHRLMVRAKVEPSDNSVEVTRKFSEPWFVILYRTARYGTIHTDWLSSLGALLIIETQWEHLLCPCRHYDDKAAEAAQGFWKKPG